jgi:plasmid replication initiation protein
MMLPTTKRNNSILKHPDAIHVAAKKNGKFNLLHRKMLNTLSFLAKEDVEQFGNLSIDQFLDQYEGKEVNHQANVTDFKTVLKFNSNDTAYLRNVITELMATVLEFDVLKDEDERAYKAMPLLTNAEIENGIVKWSYRSEIRRMLLSPERYQRLNLDITNSFGQDAALALYENVIRFERLHRTPWFAIPDLRVLIGANSSSYAEYKLFNNRVLKPALKQIEEVSGFKFKPIIKKRGKRNAFLKFEITQVKDQDLFTENAEEAIPDDDLRSSLLLMGLKDKQVNEMYEAYDLAYLEEKVIWLQRELCVNSSIKNPASFAYCAIRDDYATNAVDVNKQAGDILRTNEAGIQATNSAGCPMYPIEIIKAHLSQDELKSFLPKFKSSAKYLNKTLSQEAFNTAIKGSILSEHNNLHEPFLNFVRGKVFMDTELSLKIKNSLEENKSEEELEVSETL